MHHAEILIGHFR